MKPFKAKAAPGFFDVEMRMQFLEQVKSTKTKLKMMKKQKI